MILFKKYHIILWYDDITYELSFVVNCYSDKIKNIVNKLYQNLQNWGIQKQKM